MTSRDPCNPSIPHTIEIADSSKTTSVYDRPPFSKRSECVFLWEDIDGETFSHTIQCYYDELVHWKKNLFKIPSGRSGKEFIVEMTRLLNAYANSSTLESIVFKAIMSMPALILQKPYPKSRDKENTAHLLCRLKLWYKGDVNALLTEGRLIQKLYKDKLERTTNNNTADERRARTFAHLMMQGKVKAALRMLSQDSNAMMPEAVVLFP